ncbi:MAG: hypothetical protein ACHP9Y_05810, partial [Gammaproteobacteria bacterium]
MFNQAYFTVKQNTKDFVIASWGWGAEFFYPIWRDPSHAKEAWFTIGNLFADFHDRKHELLAKEKIQNINFHFLLWLENNIDRTKYEPVFDSNNAITIVA